MKSFLASALAFTLALSLAPAQARETKVVILLESDGVGSIQCGDAQGFDKQRVQRCVDLSKSESEDLHSRVLVQMKLDPDCAGMGITNTMGDMANFGPSDQRDYINAAVTYSPMTNENWWWLNIVKMNGKEVPGYMSGKASTPKEMAHQLCHIIHQEKITRR